MSDTTANILSDQNAPEQPMRARTKHIGMLGTDSIALYINNADNPLVIDVLQEAILGRFTPNSPSQPRVDLMPYGAYEKGVSRMHSVIRRTGSGGLTIEDLLSNNGTFLNGVRLPPRVPYQLASGNRLKLGQLEIEIFFGDAGQTTAPITTLDAADLDTNKSAGAIAEAARSLDPRPTVTVSAETPAGPQPGVSTHVLAPESPTAVLTHYHGEVSIDPQHLFSETGRLAEEIIRQFISLIGYDIEIKVQIDVRGKQGFDEPTIQGITDKTKNFKFTRSEFDSK
jgi:pSer/pThr/pTyr-binding forkhead associated (FHA) protein